MSGFSVQTNRSMCRQTPACPHCSALGFCLLVSAGLSTICQVLCVRYRELFSRLAALYVSIKSIAHAPAAVEKPPGPRPDQ